MSLQTYIAKSPAKLNLFLHVHQLRDDGYHDLKTYFQLIDLCDELTFTLNTSNIIDIHNPSIDIPQESDLCYRAVQMLKPYADSSLGVKIDVQKNIPDGGGLGGGSSNAATVLTVLNQLWGIQLPNDQLLEIALTLGSDVPIFVLGQSSYAEGRGEVFSDHIPSNMFAGKTIAIIKPNVHASTPTIFQSPKLHKRPSAGRIQKLEDVLFQNDFEPVVFSLYPEIAEACQRLSAISPAYLTGTGACIYSILDSDDQQKHIEATLTDNYQTFIVTAIPDTHALEKNDIR